MNLSALIQSLRSSLQRIESRLLQGAMLETQPAPALAGIDLGFDQQPETEQSFMWMAAPKKRRTIEVNRTRRRAESKLLKVKSNIEPCPECGHLKQKHIMCGVCYAKVRHETSLIREQIRVMEGGPMKAPAVDSVILYEGEAQSEQDKTKRIVEQPRKRPAWFKL